MAGADDKDPDGIPPGAPGAQKPNGGDHGEDGPAPALTDWEFVRRFGLVVLFGIVGGILSYFLASRDGETVHFSEAGPISAMLTYAFVGCGAGLIWTFIIGGKDIERASRGKMLHILALCMVGGITWEAVYKQVGNGKPEDVSPELKDLFEGGLILDRANSLGQLSDVTLTQSQSGEPSDPRDTEVVSVLGAQVRADLQTGTEKISQAIISEAVLSNASPEQQKIYHEQLGKSLVSAVSAIDAVITPVGDVPTNTTLNDLSRIEQQVAEKLELAVVKSGDPTAKQQFDEAWKGLRPRVYMQCPQAHEALAKELAGKIRDDLKFAVPGIEFTGEGRSGRTPKVTEVRYFYEDDKETAEKVLAIVKASIPSAQLELLVSLRGRSRQGHIEVWLSDDAKS